MIDISVRRAMILLAWLTFVNKLAVIFFAVYTPIMWGTSDSQIGIFFFFYSIMGCIFYGVLDTFGDWYGFDYSLTLTLAFTACGFLVVVVTSNFVVFAFGMMLTGSSVAAIILTETYLGKLSQVSHFLGEDSSNHEWRATRQFIPFMVLAIAATSAAAPPIIVALYEHDHLDPFIAGLSVSIFFTIFSIMFFQGNYQEIAIRANFPRTDALVQLIASTQETDTWMVFRVSLISAARFVAEIGARSIESFYIAFMYYRFGFSLMLMAIQMSSRMIVEFLCHLLMRRMGGLTGHMTYWVLLGSGLLCVLASSCMFTLTKHADDKEDIELFGMWALYIVLGIGHPFYMVSINSLIIDTASTEFMIKANLWMGMLTIGSFGIGPFIFVLTHANLFLFQALTRTISVGFFVIFLLVSCCAKD